MTDTPGEGVGEGPDEGVAEGRGDGGLGEHGGGSLGERLEERPTGQPDERLDALRDEIRTLDETLIGLVGRRRTLAVEIGQAKAALGMPILDPSQEARVVRRAAEVARKLGVDEELTRDVIWRIIASARDAQEGRTRWGPPLADSDDSE